ncbi:MAG: glyoxalase/bleomycin resistance/dioxygenase family protein [Pseudomonadota bacterium]|nr:glyoxalase/bleomycin resistance/dioxygenase family protein [Pseudomonadota bacterium]
MSGPARAGLFVYAVDATRVARFYQNVVGMEILHEREDLIVLQSPDIQLLVHKIPAAIANGISIEVPPIRRENTALKFFFTVQSLDSARNSAGEYNGEISNETWDGPGFIACNGIDPEGNVFQIREGV